MVEMLPMVQIVPEMSLALDPASGVVGASLGAGVVILSMDEINEAVTKMEESAEELVNSFDPYTSPAGSYPGRAGAHVTAATITNSVYGFVLAVIILIAALPVVVQYFTVQLLPALITAILGVGGL